MNPPTLRLPRILCGIACGLALLMAVGHGYGHLQGWPEPASEDEATLIRLASEHQWMMFGEQRTLQQVTDGFSWFFSVGLAGLAVGVASIAMPRSTPARIARRTCALGAAFCFLTVIVGYGRWPSPPVVGVSVVGLALLVSSVLFRAGRPA